MPNEIYHRSNWGESKAEDFGDVYYDHAATNKLYNHSDYYENSDGTDATLKDLNNKASIVLTPTAYSDGSLNTVIPPYGLGSELLTGFTNGTTYNFTTFETDGNNITSAIVSSAFAGAASNAMTLVSGKIYNVTFNYIKNSGDDLRVAFSSSNNGAGSQVSNNHLISESGTYTKTFTVTSSGTAYLQMGTGNANHSLNVSITNVSVKEIQEADFDFSRGSSATRVNEQGLVEDVQILSGELVQNGNFEQIGSELVTNGNFDTDSDWTKGTGWTISGGSANCDGTQTGNTNLNNSSSNGIVNNKFYKIVYTISNYVSGSIRIKVGNTGFGVYHSSNGTYTQYLKAEVTTFPYAQFNADANFIGSVDNVSVKEVAQNWTPNTNATLSIDSGRLKVAISGGSGYPSQSITTEVGKTYKVTADAFIGTSSRLAFWTNADSQFRNLYADGSFNFTFVATSTSTQLRLYVYDDGAYGFWDNVSVVKVINDTDLPRIDYTDGTGSLLLEPQRTNSLPYSEDFTTYNDNDLNIESNTQETLSPQGVYNANKFTATGTDPYIFKSGINVTANTQTASIYVKGVGNSIGKDGRILFWYIGTAGGSSLSIPFTLTSNWQRVEGSSTPTSSGTLAIRVDLPNTAEVGDESYVYGFQMEEGSYATSYIPTSGSSVTRSADVANNSGNADLFNDSEGVLYAQFTALSDDNTSRTVSINNTSSNRVFLSLRATTGQVNSGVVVGGVLQGSAMSYAISQTSDIKLAIKYKQNDFSLFVNGIQASASSGNVFTSGTLNDLSFDSGSGAEDFYGKVKCVAVFKEALSNDLLERLTGEGYESFRLLAEANNYTII